MEKSKLNNEELYLLLKYIAKLNMSHNYMRAIIHLLPELMESDEINAIQIDIKVLSEKLCIKQNEIENIISLLLEIGIIKCVEQHNQCLANYYMIHLTNEELNNRIAALDELFVSITLLHKTIDESTMPNTPLQDIEYLKPGDLKENTSYTLHLFTTIDDIKRYECEIYIVFIYPGSGMQYYCHPTEDGKMEYIPFIELRYPGYPTTYDTIPGDIEFQKRLH